MNNNRGRNRTGRNVSGGGRNGGYSERIYSETPRVVRMPVVKREKTVPTTNIASLALWLLVLLLLLFYIGGYVYSYLSRPKITETKIRYGSIDQTQLFDGVIVRDEKVYNSEHAGLVVFSANEYDRVKKGSVVCSVQDADEVEKIEESLSQINKSIISIQESRADFSWFNDEIRAANGQIKRIADDLSFALSENKIQNLYALKDKVNQTLDVRNRMLLTESRGSLSGLSQEREIVQNRLLSAKHNVSVAESGIVSYIIDGTENILGIDKLNSITKEQTEMKVEFDGLEYAKTVRPGEPIFKIVQNEWFIAAYIDAKLTRNWVLNSIKTIYVKSGDEMSPLEARIHKLEDAIDSTYVVFKLNREMIDYLGYRSVEFSVENGVVEGLKIPNATIADKTLLKIPAGFVSENDGKPSVTKMVMGGQETVSFTPEMSDEEYYYVILGAAGLDYGDTLISGGNSVQINEIENVKGVYIINTGATVFKKINFEGSFSTNSTHTVLDPDYNKSLKVHDKIVAEAKYVKDDQLVYQ